MAKRDQDFIQWIMQWEFAQRLSEIEEFCAARDIDKVAIEYNFMVAPPKIQYGTLFSCPIDDQEAFNRMSPEWEKVIATSPPDLPGKTIFSRAYIPMGNSSLSMVAMRHLLDAPMLPASGAGEVSGNEQLAVVRVT